jgi:predicted PurR-regulated permease PerM
MRRRSIPEDGDATGDAEFVELDVKGLSGLFAAPGWLRDFGITSWLLLGMTLLLAGIVWLLSLTESIVMPVLTAGIVAAVSAPVVGWLQGRRVPRGVGSALLLLALVAIGAGVMLAILTGVGSESSHLSSHLHQAADKIAGWLHDLGVSSSKAQHAKQDVSDSLSKIVPALLGGVAHGIEKLSSLVFFLSLTALSLFFLLKDGPSIRAWTERNSGLPEPVAHVISQRTLQALRGYFAGVTAVACFNALVVSLGALALGVPDAGTIAVVTFVGAYIPYLGAWGAGAFSVVIALGGAGTGAAVGMIVVQLLANGILQQLIQPIAYGAALGIHPLAVLVVTIGAGSLFGAAGLILGAPVTSAIVRISADLSRARQREAEAGAGPVAPATAPG